MRKLWNALRRPSARWSVLALVATGIVIGIALIVSATRWDQSHQHNRILCQLPQYATGV